MAKAFRFGPFVLDMDCFELRRDSEIVPVEPLVLDLIAYLVEQAGAVLDYETLIQAVWKGRIVSENTISTAIKSARKALGDSGKTQKYIRTIRGRGVQFSAVVEVEPPAAAFPNSASRIAIQPAIYVRPIKVLGGHDLSPLCRLLQVRMRSFLNRIPLLRVASSFEQADLWTDPRDFRSKLGMTLVLDLCLQQSGDSLTADLTLTETLHGFDVWARQFRVPTGDGAAEALLHEVIRRLEPSLMQVMVEELKSVPGDPGAREKLLRAIGLLSLKGWRRSTFLEATGLIEAAIAQEPDLALSHAYLAMLKALGHRVGILRDSDAVVPEALASAERALELESQDSTVLGLVGCSLVDVGQVDRAVLILRKAIELEPQNGQAKTALGAALMTKGDFEAAVVSLSEGIACSPADSRCSVWGTALALGQLALGRLDDALEAAGHACMEDDRNYLPRLALAVIHLARGDGTAATAALQECVRAKPDLSLAEVSCIVGGKRGAVIWDLARPLLPLQR